MDPGTMATVGNRFDATPTVNWIQMIAIIVGPGNPADVLEFMDPGTMAIVVGGTTGIW